MVNGRRAVVALAGVSVFLSGCAGPAQARPPRPSAEELRKSMNQRAEAAAVPKLVTLVDDRRLATLNPEDYTETALRDILKLTTPTGYRLKYRFYERAVPVVQAVSMSQDPQLQGRLLEVARFESGRRARSQSLLLLAAKKDPAHVKFFKEALLDRDVGIQFAAVEGLEAWAQPEALPLLLGAAGRDWSPLIRIFSAQAAWRLGAPEGRDWIVKFLSDTNWLMRSMAARYLGDLGSGPDTDLVLSRIGRERDNNIALAELCIAGLKLSARRGPLPAPAPAPPARRTASAPVADLFELEPLVVTAPRIRASGAQLVPPQIDAELVGLLEKVATQPPDELLVDQTLRELRDLVTPEGFGLYVRYSDINFLLTEGLAGTSNLTLVARLENIARLSDYAPVQASAYVALGYDQTRVDFNIFSQGLREPDLRVRFGTVEGLAANANPLVKGMLAEAAQNDASVVVRLFAAQALGRRGDSQAVDILRRHLGDPDWVVRALAAFYLGQLGDDIDFERILVNVDRETEDTVIAENCLAILRMSR